MVMRNRRIRLLALAILITITFVLYSRSDPTTIEGAKKYAQQTYRSAYDQTIGKSKGQSSGGQADSVSPAVEPKKDEPFRVDFGAYSKAAAAEETEAPGIIPPPAAAVPPPPPPPKVEPAPIVEPKKDDPMRVDFAAYSKAAAADPEETQAPAGLNKEVIANPNPIVGVVGAGDAAPAKPATPAKPKAADKVQAVGEGRMEIDVSASETGAAIHWSKRTENYPPTSTHMFPHAEATPMPKIQYDFKKAGVPGADTEKLAAIKSAAQHSWKGYKDKAMGHDEVKPLSGKVANPFNAWGATLVDSLDTLWLMGMVGEFEEALEYVKKIDFTTSRRADIPLFETTIRYMGGLLGAYEISSRNYKVLLDQASQLGDILYGAFDTPNRMPMTYYQWKPAFASQGHRAPVRTIMAELGSLSLEFTRLGQLVGQSKYYDAIARITDALEEWQPKTRIPGLWPNTLDASGCKKLPSTDVDEFKDTKAASQGKSSSKSKNVDPDPAKPPTTDSRAIKSDIAADPFVVGKEPGLGKIAGFGSPIEEGSLDTAAGKSSALQKSGFTKMIKRALDTLGLGSDDPIKSGSSSISDTLGSSALSGFGKEETRSTATQTVLTDDDCIPQGLASTSEYGSDIFTFGAAADSTYEYLPKMHMMTGGRTDQYARIYKKAITAAKEWLIFRPMIPDENRELLFAGNVDTKPSGVKGEYERDFKPVMSHLTCFVGGMFAMSGKLFNNPEDVEIGAKLTDGCIWAYNSTASGIMPEVFGLHACESKESCKWDQKAYYKALDPYEDVRLGKSKPKTTDSRVLSPSKGDSLEKRQFGGGEMQYGVHNGPETLPASAAAIVAEVPTRDMGHSGFSGSYTPDEISIKSTFDAGASQNLPTDTKAVPAAGAVNGAPYPAAPDANGKIGSTVQDSKDAFGAKIGSVVQDSKDIGAKAGSALQDAKDTVGDKVGAAVQESKDIGGKIGSALQDTKDVVGDKLGSAVQEAKDVGAKIGSAVKDTKDAVGAKVGSTVEDLKDASAKVGSAVKDSKDAITDKAAAISEGKDRLPPAVPGKIAPTVGDTNTDNTPEKKIALGVPDKGLAPISGATDKKSGGGSALEGKTVPEPATGLRKPPTADSPAHEPLPHEEYVKDKIKNERLPAGMTGMYDKTYLLRPEAIESVFYMYRITGNQYWRDRGWEMWQAISKHTAAPYGAASLEDISKPEPEKKDSEESFWLAETLKYFYLLFDDPDRYSLDDWVLNTEAHFFARLGA